MSRYLFQIDDGTLLRDEIGTEFSSIAAAQCEAVRYAGDLISDHASKFWSTADWGMTVTSETGLTLFTLQLTGTESPAVRAMARPH